MAAGAGSPCRNSAHSSAAALDFSARPGCYLFFRVLLAHFSDQGPYRPARHPARRGLSARRGKLLSRLAAFLVRANVVLVRRRQPRTDVDYLARPDRISCRRLKPLAARSSGGLPDRLSFICRCSAGFFRLSVGWNVAGGRLHLTLLCAAGLPAWSGRNACTFAPQPVSSALGMVPH